MRFIRWLIASERLRGDHRDFAEACRSLLIAAGEPHLPQPAQSIIEDDSLMLANEVWKANTHTVAFEAASALQAEEDQRALQRTVEALTAPLTDAKQVFGLPLRRLNEIVCLPQAPTDQDEAAVWHEFQWTRSLYQSLNRGTEGFRDWLLKMTIIEGQKYSLPGQSPTYC